MISKKEQILKAFEDLDIYSLALLLNENQTYQDVTKEIFLRILSVTVTMHNNSAHVID